MTSFNNGLKVNIIKGASAETITSAVASCLASKNIAIEKANEASISANSAESIASMLTTQASISTTQASVATTQATIATTKANESAGSASSALISKTNAATSEANALSYKDSASTSATIAITKANEALGYRDAALTYQHGAESAYGSTLGLVNNLELPSVTHTVDTVDDFGTIPSGIDTVIVKDINRGGTFIYDATQSAVNNGGTIFDGWVRQYSGAVNVKWFGAVDVSNFSEIDYIDSKSAIQNAINYISLTEKTLYFGDESYAIDGSLTIISLRDTTFEFSGTRLIGISNTQEDSLINVINNVNIRFIGSLTLIGNINYDSGFFLGTSGSGQTARSSFSNITFYTFTLALRVGTSAVDNLNSENSFYALQFMGCPQVLKISGSQTGASFIGCDFVSASFTGYEAYERRVIWMEGGFATIVGGEIVLPEYTSGYSLYIEPCNSSFYGNPYPVLRINGTHIETSSPLLMLSNPKGLLTPTSNIAQVSVTGSGGFVGASSVNATFMTIDDATFEGVVQVAGCNFYSEAKRNANTIYSSSALTNIEVDRSSFGKNFPLWMGGVIGGKLRHGFEIIASLNNLAGVTIASGTATPLKFSSKMVSGNFFRYRDCYNVATGIFTVPAGGLETLTISATIISPTLNGDIYVKKGVNYIVFGIITSNVISLNATMYDLTEGEQITLVLQPSTGDVVFDSTPYSFISFTASN